MNTLFLIYFLWSYSFVYLIIFNFMSYIMCRTTETQGKSIVTRNRHAYFFFSARPLVGEINHCFQKLCTIEVLFSTYIILLHHQLQIFMVLSVCAQSFQSCLTLCDPMDCSPLGFSAHGIFQAKILEWVAISSSRYYLY